MLTKIQRLILSGFVFPGLISIIGCQSQNPQQQPTLNPTPGILHAQMYNSGFRYADNNFNACSRASNGKIYYVLCSGSVDVGAQMYSFDPATGKIDHIADLTAAAGEKGLHAVAQGKGHTNFLEYYDKLYFGTHLGYYSRTANRRELVGQPPPGYKPYPGGHFISYNLTTGKFDDLAKAPEGEGILAFTMDPQRGRLYAITWPSGLFLRYDIHTHELRNLGPISLGGEKGIPGKTFRVLCRRLALDPDNGSVYFTTADGNIFRYRYDSDSIEEVKGCNLRKDVFGCLDPSRPGTMGYNWRQAIWYAPQKVFYAIHGRSGYLFKFDPRSQKVEVIGRLVSNTTREGGMYDAFSYGYLGFKLGPDGHTIYYLTGAPRAPRDTEHSAEKATGEGKESAAGNSKSRLQVEHPARLRGGDEVLGNPPSEIHGTRRAGKPTSEEMIQHGIDEVASGHKDEDNHFVTYDIVSGKRTDYGVLQLKNGVRPFFAQSIAIGKKNIYTVAKVRGPNGHVRVDLLSFPNPAP